MISEQASRRSAAARVALATLLGLPLAACNRSIDGSGNHPFDPDLGAAQTALRRVAAAEYGDGASGMAGADRPGPREISNAVHAQSAFVPNPKRASAYIWQWGQFLDHDIDLTSGATPVEPAPIPVPADDPDFAPAPYIHFNRSLYDPSTGTDPANPRQQMNEITSFIDGSMVYGSDEARADHLRTHDGTGRLRTSRGRLLPFNTDGFPNANDTGQPDESLFIAGDVRANEQVGLTAMHTLFVREHNYWAKRLAVWFPQWNGDRLYEGARAIVWAEIQAITYEEYLPLLLGPGALPPYTGYDPSVDPRIANEFSTAAFRLGHTQLNSTLLRFDRRLREIPEGHLPLLAAFFDPSRITDEGGIEPLLRGLAKQVANQVDCLVIDDVRNFLFGPPGAGGLDLASLNIQRGRDHGLPTYNGARAAYGLPPAAGYADISSDAEVQARLEDAYGPGNVEDVDFWTGAICEDLAPGALVGELVRAALVEQFSALRDGDRYFYEGQLSGSIERYVRSTRLSKVIRRNTRIATEIQHNAFIVPASYDGGEGDE